MAHFVEQWGELTNNKWVLFIVWGGFRIPFRSTTSLSSVPLSLSQSSSLLLGEEIADLLQKWVVEKVQDPETPGFYSRLFLVPKKKKNGKLRPVIDLLPLTIKLFLSQTQVSAQTFLSLLGKLSAAADFVLLGRQHLGLLQMCLLSVWRPHILPVDHYVPINNMIRFHLEWWMDNNRFTAGTSIHPLEPNTFPFHGCQSFWMGSSSRADETILSWSLVGRPIPAPYQYSRNDGQSFSTEESHKTHSPLLCYDLDRQYNSRPRWLSWMRRPTGDQEVAGSTPAEVGNILSWRLIMKYFLRSFSPFRWFKKGSCQFLAKECAQYWLTA